VKHIGLKQRHLEGEPPHMSPRGRKPFFSKDRLKEAGVRTTALIAIGAAGLGLTACGPSETKAVESPTPTASAPVTPGASETSPSSSETVSTVENSNITSMSESPEFKALSAEEQALILRLEKVDFSNATELAEQKITGEQQAFFAKVALDVYGPYVYDSFTRAFTADYETKGYDPKPELQQLKNALDHQSLGKDMTTEDIVNLTSYHRNSSIWMATKNGDPTIVEEKRQTAINVAMVLDKMAYYPDGYTDKIKTVDTAAIALVFGGPRIAASSPNVTFDKGSDLERTYRVVTFGTEATNYYRWLPEADLWQLNLTQEKGMPNYLPADQVKDAEAHMQGRGF
jgi:hypothetical protein